MGACDRVRLEVVPSQQVVDPFPTASRLHTDSVDNVPVVTLSSHITTMVTTQTTSKLVSSYQIKANSIASEMGA